MIIKDVGYERPHFLGDRCMLNLFEVVVGMRKGNQPFLLLVSLFPNFEQIGLFISRWFFGQIVVEVAQTQNKFDAMFLDVEVVLRELFDLNTDW